MDQVQDASAAVGPSLVENGFQHMADRREAFVGRSLFGHVASISIVFVKNRQLAIYRWARQSLLDP